MVAVAKVLFSKFICESLPTAVGTIEFTQVEDVAHLSRDLHLFKLLLAKRADSIAGQPKIQARFANQSFAVCTRSKIFENILADSTDELLDDFFVFWYGILG